jgi:hypothetical protein
MSAGIQRGGAAGQGRRIDGAAAAFGLSAAITILFNTALAWVKDAWAPLNDFMASLTGHHWRTHGLVDIVVFVALGFVFMQRGVTMTGVRLATIIAGSVVVAGAGLALWFVLT